MIKGHSRLLHSPNANLLQQFSTSSHNFVKAGFSRLAITKSSIAAARSSWLCAAYASRLARSCSVIEVAVVLLVRPNPFSVLPGCVGFFDAVAIVEGFAGDVAVPGGDMIS
jgi:hypothetical protein